MAVGRSSGTLTNRVQILVPALFFLHLFRDFPALYLKW
jgi:hypothetical protein